MSETEQKFEAWMVIELFGHQKIAGYVTEAVIGGCSFLRVDVPAINDDPAFTRFFGNGAIYSMTPTTEEVVRRVVEYHKPQAMSVYVPPVKQIAPSTGIEMREAFDDDDENDFEDEEIA
jgi:hypothetical protein